MIIDFPPAERFPACRGIFFIDRFPKRQSIFFPGSRKNFKAYLFSRVDKDKPRNAITVGADIIRPNQTKGERLFSGVSPAQRFGRMVSTPTVDYASRLVLIYLTEQVTSTQKRPLERRPERALRLLPAEPLRPFVIGEDFSVLSQCAGRVLGFFVIVILHSADILSGFIVHNVESRDSGKGRGAIDHQTAGNRIHLIERHFQIFLFLFAHGTPSFLLYAMNERSYAYANATAGSCFVKECSRLSNRGFFSAPGI